MSNKARKRRKREGSKGRQRVDHIKRDAAMNPTRDEAGTPSVVQSRSWLGAGTQNAIGLMDRHQRPTGFGHVVVSAFLGAFVGTMLALWVVHVTDRFPTPWTYMVNLASVLLLKVILQWIWTIWVNPFAAKQARLFVAQRTRQELPDSNANFSQNGSKQVQSLVTTVIAAVGVATVLVTTEDLKPAWLLEPLGIVIASASLAALTLTAEAMSTNTTIYALWKNRHQYQETPSYKKGGRGNDRGSRGRR